MRACSWVQWRSLADDNQRPFRFSKLNAHYAILLLIASLYGPGAAVLVDNALQVWPALAISLILSICGIIRLTFRSPMVFTVVNVVTALALGGTIPAFFLATGPIVTASNSMLYDNMLLEADIAILGGVYPNGQLSLFLDQSETLNPETSFGRTYTEILQLVYVSYYFWGALPFFYLLYKYISSHEWRSPKRDKQQIYPNNFETALSARYLTELKLYLCGWMSAYFITFLLNRSFPAKSPRLYLKDMFEHHLEGWGLASSLIGIATDDTSFGSFPSGHFNQTLVCALFAFRLKKSLGIVIFVAAGGIALATQVLRYHYFVDIASGLLVAAMAVSYGFNWSAQSYNEQIEASLVDYEERQGLAKATSSKTVESIIESNEEIRAVEAETQDMVTVDLDEMTDITLETIPNPAHSAKIVLRGV